MKRLASVDELNSKEFRQFMSSVNDFAMDHRLRVHTNWSKVWEYPWTWQYIRRFPFPKITILDIGSELSPMPWYFASLGARVTMVETKKSYVAKWRRLRKKLGFAIDWALVSGPELPFAEDRFDLVTSYSVIEHIPDKASAVREAIRVLKPGGVLCLTFDICEPSLGMVFPEWNGAAFDMASFDRLVWNCEMLQPLDAKAQWNVEDIQPFLEWHLQSAPHHKYVVAGALMLKR